MRIVLAALLSFCAAHAAAGEALKLRYGQAYSSAHSIFSLPISVAAITVDPLAIPLPGWFHCNDRTRPRMLPPTAAAANSPSCGYRIARIVPRGFHAGRAM
jgi:hypothetical protein